MWLKLRMLSKCIIKWKRIVSRLIHSIKFYKKQNTQVYFSTCACVLLVITSMIYLSIFKRTNDQYLKEKRSKLRLRTVHTNKKRVVSNVWFGVWDENVSPSTQCPCAKYRKARLTLKMVHQVKKNILVSWELKFWLKWVGMHNKNNW